MNHDIPDCGVKKHFPSIEHAGDNVDLDLTKPIDCSQMDVYEISSVPDEDWSFKMYMMRKTVLHAFVFNDEGEREELTITFELKSQRRPKLRKL